MDQPPAGVGLVRWSPNRTYDSFLHINLVHREVQVFEPTGYARPGRFDFRKVSKHGALPQLMTFDWSPVAPGLLAVGTQSGTVNILKIDDNKNADIELGLKMARLCQAVAFNTTGLLAVGLDRVRADTSLYIWDVNDLSRVEPAPSAGAFSNESTRLKEYARYEHGASVSSVKFFEDSPQTLVMGIRSQSVVKILDLRGEQRETTPSSQDS